MQWVPLTAPKRPVRIMAMSQKTIHRVVPSGSAAMSSRSSRSSGVVTNQSVPKTHSGVQGSAECALLPSFARYRESQADCAGASSCLKAVQFTDRTDISSIVDRANGVPGIGDGLISIALVRRLQHAIVSSKWFVPFAHYWLFNW